MPTQKKIEKVAELATLFREHKVAVATDYRTLRVSDMELLRRRLREAGMTYRVIKNKLALIAAAEAGRTELEAIIEGPTALVLAKDDPISAARILTEFIRTSRLPLEIRGAVLDGRRLGKAEVEYLATLPSREVLLAQVVGGIAAPLQALVSVLSNVLGSLPRALEARRRQLGGAE